MRVGDEVADAPAGDGEGLGEAGDEDGALAHAGKLGWADVLCVAVDEVLVDLVGKDEEVVLDGDCGEGFELGAGEDLAGGIRGSVDEDGAGVRGDGGMDGVEVERPVRSGERDEDRLDAHGAQSSGVVAVSGLEEEDFVAGVEQGHGGGVVGAGDSAGDEDLAVGVDGEAVGAGDLGGDGAAQAGDAFGAGVDVVAGADGGDCALGDDGWDLGVADALGEVDAVDAVAFGGHGANLGLD